MIVVTGAAGFIGSCMVRKLNDAGYTNILAVDDFSRPDKNANLEGKTLAGRIERNNFVRWLERNHGEVTAVLHLGARTDTTEMSESLFDALNLEYSRALWILCSGYEIPFFYASSAATYGLGEHGYSDDHAGIPALSPLNPYGWSKQNFDLWVLKQIANPQGVQAPPRWAGFKFFNVYGPNEYHKGRMASVIFHTARQIKATGKMNLFRSHRPDFKDGEQSRDFIYVKDVVDVLFWFLENDKAPNAIYNLGTGKARAFLHLAEGTFHALGLQPDISFVDTPADIRDKYQYFTEADMTKLRQAGYNEPFYGLEAGIEDYVQRYLKNELIW
jgi:ADP-L-glycero-D-manno-heptose 6-epimerase